MDTNTRPNEQANSHAPVAAAAIAAAGAPSSTEEANIPGIREQILANARYRFPNQDLHVIVFWSEDMPGQPGYEADLIGFNEPEGEEQAYLRCAGVHQTVVGALRGLMVAVARFMFAVDE